MAKKRSKKSIGRTLQKALLVGDVKFAGHVEVKGGYYHGMWEAKVDGQLKEGAWLKMVREPDNKFDSNAIGVWLGHRTGCGAKIGYVAKEKAEQLAPYMDLGVKHALRVLQHSAPNQPLRITARLYIKR